MPRKNIFHGKVKQFNKNNKHIKGKKTFKKTIKKNVTDNESFKKFKHIRRTQETEEALRLQKKLEQKVQPNTDLLESSSEEEDVNLLDQLISTFKTNSGVGISKSKSAIESSESSDSEMETEKSSNESESMDEDVKIHSVYEEQTIQDICLSKADMSEENDITEENDIIESDSSDDLIDDTLLHPEKSTNKKVINSKIMESLASDPEIETEEEFDQEIETKETKQEIETNLNDIFSIHLGNELSPNLLECVNTTHNSTINKVEWPKLGRLQIEIPTISKNESVEKKKKPTLLDDNEVYATEGTIPIKIDYTNINMNELLIKNQIQKNVVAANTNNNQNNEITSKPFTEMQAEIFSAINNYQDLYFPQRTHANGEEIRFIYCLHALNHILKTRTRILHHNAKLGKSANTKTPTIIPDNFRDQGLFRPKVLIILPFKESALRVVNTLIALIFPELSGKVMHHTRFLEEFQGDGLYFPKKNPKPEDYELTFAGNSDDTFRLGISITKKCMKLYSDFYTSDILIASPLGLRMIVGAPGEKERDYDFLASIELLILDQVDIFLAQNWDHLLHVLDHLHLQPQSARNTDFSRVRPWCLNGWTRFYRQTLLFTSHEFPEVRSLFNSRCANYRGKIRMANPISNGSIRHVAVQIPQVFHRVDVTSIQSSYDQRFNHFINTILPQYRGPSMAHCLIYIPSYFDFVRLRNFFKKDSISFVQICEYTKDGKIARSRDMFFHSGAHFLLYSERAHFFRRTRIKGIRHIIMYQPPTWPHFYSEMINLMQEANQNPRDGGENSMTVTVLYTKYDMLQVASIVGSEKASKMSTSDKTTHMFMTSD